MMMIRFFLICLPCFFVQAISAQNIETVVQRSGGGECRELVISPDGLLLAKINDDALSSEVEIWNTKTGLLQRVINTGNNTAGGQSFLSSVRHVRFWKGSKSIITGTLDGDHEVYDVATGKLVKKLNLKSYIEGVFAICEKTGIFVALHPLSIGKNQLLFCDAFTNTVYDSVALNMGGITALEFSPDGSKIVIGTEEGGFHILEIATFNRTLRGDSMHKAPITFIQWTSDNYLLTASDDDYSVFNLTNNKLVSNGNLGKGGRIVTSPTEDCYYEAQTSNILKRSGSGIVQKYMGIDPDRIHQVAISTTDQSLYVLSDNFIRVWDLENILQLTCKKRVPGASGKYIDADNFRFIPSRHSFVSQQKDSLVEESIDSGRVVKKYVVGKGKVNSLQFTTTASPIISIQGKIMIWEADKFKELAISRNDSILFIFPSEDKIVAVSPNDSLVKVYDAKKGTGRTIAFKGNVHCGAFSPAKQQFVIAGENLYLVDANTLKYKKLYDAVKENYVTDYGGVKVDMEIPGMYKQVCFSKDGQRLFAINAFGQVKIWNLQTFTIDTILNLHASQVQVSPGGDRLFIVSENEIMWIRTKDLSMEAHLVFLAKGDFIMSLADNYYKASRNGAKAVAFRKGMQSSAFDQFDILYNRPDIVAQRLGNPSPLSLEGIQKAVQKRFKKMGFQETGFDPNDLDAPVITIKDYNKLPTNIKEQEFAFTVSAHDKKSPIVTCSAFINGVPFAAKEGFNLSKNGTAEERKSMSIKLRVALDPGKNLIEVACRNEKGIESTRESFEIFYEAAVVEKPTLYFIGIGAGEYLDNNFNLKYPPKDIADVSKLLGGRTDIYKKINTTIFTNAQVTKDAIKGLKQLLEGTKIGDQVIIYWSGHGVLNKELSYYLATYNMDFAKPEIHGLAYDDLEDLLDNIPARKKLLFIDACHSGGFDKDDVQLTQATNKEVINQTKGTRGIIVTNKASVNVAALLNDLFADTRRSSGANIISAAGGAEYALEGDNWGNGVFTYALLQGLKDKKADVDKDGIIMVSELQSYLQEKVPELTQGRQKPTSRTENLVTDWRIW